MKQFYFFCSYFFLLFTFFCQAQISFTKTQELASSTTDAIFFDIENDGDLDLYFGKFGNNPLWINDGMGNYTYITAISNNTVTKRVFYLDYDNDGDNDLMALNVNDIFINQNDGNNNYNNTVTWAIAPNVNDGDAGDIDGDGDIDFVFSYNNIGTSSPYNIAKITYNGGGYSAPTTTNILNSNTFSTAVNVIKLSDIDGDNDLDMIVSESSSDNRIYRNDGNGNFNTYTILSTGVSYELETGDIDNDGDIDLIVSNTLELRLWLNDGSGNFSDSGQTISGVFYDIKLADINNDNYLDLILGLNGGNKVWVNTQNPTSMFSDTGLSLGNETTYAIDTGDINGDGKIDLIFANRNNSQKSDLWINNSTLSLTENTIETVKLHPNPTSNTFTIKTNKQIDYIEVVNINGLLVKAFNKNHAEYNIEDLSNGLYFINIISKGNSTTKKLIKQ